MNIIPGDTISGTQPAPLIAWRKGKINPRAFVIRAIVKTTCEKSGVYSGMIGLLTAIISISVLAVIYGLFGPTGIYVLFGLIILKEVIFRIRHGYWDRNARPFN